MARTGSVGLLLNAAGFQVVWLGCVWGAGQGGLPWLGPVLALAFAAATLSWGGRYAEDIRLLALILLLGLVLDTAWVRLGWLDYPHPWPLEGIAPGWIMGLWLGFGMTLNHSLAALRRRPVLAAALGGIGGPMAYLAAEKVFGAVVLVAPNWRILCVLAVAWAVLLPLLFALTEKSARITRSRAGP